MKTAVVAAWLFAEAMKLPHTTAPGETHDDYTNRIRNITGRAAEEATPYADGRGWTSTELAALEVIVWNGESLFDARIHAGEPHPTWTQDHGLARCGMQIHAGGLVPETEWQKLAGTDEDSTRMCAKYGARVLVAMARQCGVWNGVRADRNRVAKTLAAYASGGNCMPGDRDWQRADRWLKIMATRPDRSPVDGFRRAAPAEVPPAVLDRARWLSAQIGQGATVGSTSNLKDGSKTYKLIVEHHAEGKTGVSVLVAEN